MAETDCSTSHPSINNQVARAFAKGVPGSERRVLERVAEASALGEVVPPELQKIANAILGVVLLTGKIPEKAPGRPKDERFALKGVEMAYRYFDLLDQDGCARNDALGLAAKQINASERHVERAVHDYEWLIGCSTEARSRFRAWRDGLSNEEYREAVLLELRFHEGSRPTGKRPLKDCLAGAPAQVTAIRNDLLRLFDRASGNRSEQG